MSLLKMPAVLRKLLENGGLGPHVKRELWPVDLDDFTFPPTCAAQTYKGKDGRNYLIAGYGTDGDQEYTIFVTVTTLLHYMDQGYKVGNLGSAGGFTQYHPDKPPEYVAGGDFSKPLIFYMSGECPDHQGNSYTLPGKRDKIYDYIDAWHDYNRAAYINAARKTGHSDTGAYSRAWTPNGQYIGNYSWSHRTGTYVEHGTTYKWIPEIDNLFRPLESPVRVKRAAVLRVTMEDGTTETHAVIPDSWYPQYYTPNSPVNFAFRNRGSKSSLLNGYTFGSYQYDTRAIFEEMQEFNLSSLNDTQNFMDRYWHKPYFQPLNYVIPILIDGEMHELHTRPEYSMDEPRLCRTWGPIHKYRVTRTGPSAYQVRFGEARWHLTHWRQFLNSNAYSIDGWWRQIGTWDCKTYAEANVDKGFLAQIDPDIAAAAIAIPKKTYYYDDDGDLQVAITHDKVWIASLEELGLTPFHAGEDQCLCHWRYNPGDAATELIPSAGMDYPYSPYESNIRRWAGPGYLVRSVDDSGNNKFVIVNVDKENCKFDGMRIVDFRPGSTNVSVDTNCYAIVCIAAKGIWG
jgi:hypothetical protein